MKATRVRGTPEKLQQLLEEATMSGYQAEIDGDELVVYYGVQPKKKGKPRKENNERWSKRERNFGYTRG